MQAVYLLQFLPVLIQQDGDAADIVRAADDEKIQHPVRTNGAEVFGAAVGKGVPFGLGLSLIHI